MDYNYSASRLLEDSQFARDYRAVKTLGHSIRRSLVKYHAPRVLHSNLSETAATQLDSVIDNMAIKPIALKPSWFSGRRADGLVIDEWSTLKMTDHMADAMREGLRLSGSSTGRMTHGNPTVSLHFLPKETFDMSSTNFIQTKTFVNGQDVATMSDDAVYATIGKMEAEIKQLDSLTAKPASLVKKIDGIKANIAALVKLVDERDAKKTAASTPAA